MGPEAQDKKRSDTETALRDQFAMVAFTGFMNENPPIGVPYTQLSDEELAFRSYAMADLLLEARK